MIRQLLWLLQTFLFYCGTWLIALLPERMMNAAGSAVGLLMYRLLSRRRRIAEDNLAKSFEYMRVQPGWNCSIPDAAGIAREVFRNIGRSLVETCRLYHGKGDGLLQRIEMRGTQHYLAAREQGKGLIFMAGHCANWELGALGFGRLLQTPVSAVARRQDNPYLNRMVERMRMRYDNRVIYKDQALRQMLGVIRKNGVVGLLVDQAALPSEGALIQFLGRPAWATKAPVVLARRTGAPVLPVFAHREGDRLVIEILPELVFNGTTDDQSLAEDVQRYSRIIEAWIVRHPTDWYWVHRRWKRTEGLTDAGTVL